MEKFSAEQILEIFAESLRQARRNYIKPLDLSSVVINLEDEELIVSIYDPAIGRDRTFFLEMSELYETDSASVSGGNAEIPLGNKTRVQY